MSAIHRDISAITGRYSGKAPQTLAEMHRTAMAAKRAVAIIRRKAIAQLPAPAPEKPKDQAPKRSKAFKVARLVQQDQHVLDYRQHLAELANSKLQTDVFKVRIIMDDFWDACPYSMHDVFSARRFREYARWRQALMFALKKGTSCSYPRIARYAHRSDHTTVLHSVRVVQKAIDDGTATTVTGPRGTVFYLR